MTRLRRTEIRENETVHENLAVRVSHNKVIRDLFYPDRLAAVERDGSPRHKVVDDAPDVMAALRLGVNARKLLDPLPIVRHRPPATVILAPQRGNTRLGQCSGMTRERTRALSN
jgi:hypothetical protein